MKFREAIIQARLSPSTINFGITRTSTWGEAHVVFHGNESVLYFYQAGVKYTVPNAILDGLDTNYPGYDDWEVSNDFDEVAFLGLKGGSHEDLPTV